MVQFLEYISKRYSTNDIIHQSLSDDKWSSEVNQTFNQRAPQSTSLQVDFIAL